MGETPAEPKAAPLVGAVYTGRLAFDGDTCFHLDPDGYKLVTDGKGHYTYAAPDDPSHFDKFHKRLVVVQGTTPDDPHHVEPLPDDANVLAGSLDPANGRTIAPVIPNVEAPTATSHTEADASRHEVGA
jgi:hypothetical protein